MALHTTPASMLKESLVETLETAKFCSNYRKTDDKWGEFKTGGCLGYPAGILLFSVIDSIGSYFRKNPNFKVEIDSKLMTIDSDGWQHFKVLNSKYFGQKLSLNFIKALYSKFRSCLTHNSILGKETVMFMNNKSIPKVNVSNTAFLEGKGPNNSIVYAISIQELCELCEKAIAEFSKDIDNIVPSSKQGNTFH